MARGNPQGDWLPPSLISQVLSTPFLQHLFYLSQNHPTNCRFRTAGIISTASGEAGLQHKWAGLPRRPSEAGFTPGKAGSEVRGMTSTA